MYDSDAHYIPHLDTRQALLVNTLAAIVKALDFAANKHRDQRRKGVEASIEEHGTGGDTLIRYGDQIIAVFDKCR